VAAIADDIAYDAHDIDDGLRAGLFAVDDLKAIPLIAEIIADIDRHYPGLDDVRRGAELVRELISYLISAVMTEAEQRLKMLRPQSAHDVRNFDRPMIAFPAGVAEVEAAIKAFLYQHMYRHKRVMRVMGEAEEIVSELFARYRQSPGDLPPEWLEGTGGETEAERTRRIGNFIAGMTDRFALIEHQRLFDSTPDLR
jgi:dGTPase